MLLWVVKKGGPHVCGAPLLEVGGGGVLLSHTLPGAVPSALKGLASGFGKGPGVTPPLKPPTKHTKQHTPKPRPATKTNPDSVCRAIPDTAQWTQNTLLNNTIKQ